jgi:methionyl-tRNA formyltransferase
MSALETKRLGIFADGPVGEAILGHAIDTCAPQLSLLVFASQEARAHFERSDQPARLASDCRRCCWSDLDSEVVYQQVLASPVDIAFLAWWPHLLKARHLRIATDATLNLHPSLLPHCRGKDPNFWALVEQRPFGVTIHHVDQSIDGGDIAFQRELAVDWTDTGKSLYRKAESEAVRLFAESLPAIAAGDIPRIPQHPSQGSMHYRRELEPASRLDLDESLPVREVLNRLRARSFEPHPACRFSEGGKTYEVRIDIREIESGDL